jgi:hypothetical protein
MAIGSGVALLFLVQMFAGWGARTIMKMAVGCGGAFRGLQERALLQADSERVLHNMGAVSVIVRVKIAMVDRSALRACKRVAVLNASGSMLVAVGSGAAFVGTHIAAAFDTGAAHGSARPGFHALDPAIGHATDAQVRVAMRRGCAARF